MVRVSQVESRSIPECVIMFSPSGREMAFVLMMHFFFFVDRHFPILFAKFLLPCSFNRHLDRPR